MLRADLRDARAAWIRAATDRAERKERRESGFLVFRDDAGRVLDFHAFHHTFITNLARAGVHPKQAQDLARHSDINLTLSRYTHTAVADRAAALEALPDLPVGADKTRLRATGTDDSLVGVLWGRRTPKRSSVSRRGTSRNRHDPAGDTASLDKTDTYDASGHGKSPHVKQPPVGFEPTTCGLQNRCSTD